jgi:hypothetical protein
MRSGAKNPFLATKSHIAAPSAAAMHLSAYERGELFALFKVPRRPQTEPIKPSRLDDLVQDPGSGILKIHQGASSGMAASHHGICDPFTNFVVVLVRRNPLADIFQRRGHVGDGVLVEFCQHFSLSRLIKDHFKSVRYSITAPFREKAAARFKFRVQFINK